MAHIQHIPFDGPIEVHMWRYWDGLDVLATTCPCCSAKPGQWCSHLGCVHTSRVHALFAVALDGAA